MKTKSYILTIIILAGFIQSYSCDCGFLGGFVYSHQVADIVVYGTVIEYDSIGTHNAPDNPYSIKFLIKEKFRGIENRDTIVVYGDYGADCRPYISQFKPDSDWILALHKLSQDRLTDYEVSICGEFFLPVINNKVSGQIFGWTNSGNEKTYDYQYITKIVQNPFDYPAQRPEKSIENNSDGLEFMSVCDNLPENSFDLRTLNKIVNDNISLPSILMDTGDSYLINVRAIIDKNGEFHFKGTYHFNLTDELKTTINKIAIILKNTGNWKVGMEAGKPVASELIIPILLNE